MLELLPPRHAFSNRASCEQTRAGSSSFAEVARDEDRQNSFRFGRCRRCRADARPVLAAADNGAAAGGRNLTQEQQQAGPIALPSLAPLAQYVLPAVVNISVQLNQQARAKGPESDEEQGNNGGVFPQPSATPFDQFLRRFFEAPFSASRPS